MATFGQTSILGTTNTANQCRAMGGTFNGGSGQELVSISMYLSGSTDLRLAVYQGGSLSTGPDGATLIWDGGTVTVSGAAWYTTTHPGPNPALTNGAVTWIGFKSNDAAPTWYYSSSSGDAGDFQTAEGRYNSTAVSNNEATAWPSTWPSDGGSFSAFWYSVYMTYQASAGGISIPVVMNHLRNQGIS